MGTLLKDQALAEIAERGGNVAQFFACDENGKQTFQRIRGVDPTHQFASVEDAVRAIDARLVNVRTWTEKEPDGNPFFYGKKGQTPEKVAKIVAEMTAKGFRCIVNEQIVIEDGGFSGVVYGDIAEFASYAIPRCVDDEKITCAVVPRWMLPLLVQTVYSNPFNIPYDRNTRVEFSVHPGPVGYLRQSQVVWQVEAMDASLAPGSKLPSWHHQYSQDMGHKAYGILMAHLLGLRVPHTEVIGRIIPNFTFGSVTGSKNVKWLRTCPRQQEPGRFTTHHGWLDVFQLLQDEDPECVNEACIAKRKKEAAQAKKKVCVCKHPQHRLIASIIVQDAIDPLYSGACITDASGEPIIEGIPGKGDPFMVGERAAEKLPEHIRVAVRGVWECANAQLGPVRFEWVCDRDEQVSVVQFHRGETSTFGDVLVAWEQEPIRWEAYRTEWGLEKFRQVCKRAITEGFGIVLQTNLGVTNHFVDILRRGEIPSRREAP